MIQTIRKSKSENKNIPTINWNQILIMKIKVIQLHSY